MGFSKREEVVSKDTKSKPGPGHYSKQDKFGKGVSYTFSAKVEQKFANNPGPGEYDLNDNVSRERIKSARFS